jgi:rhodanese-related sulfurtransferase
MGGMSEAVRISPAEAQAKMNDGYTYIDVRGPDEFAAGRPAGAVNVPLGDDFAARMGARYAKDAKLVLGCRTGIRSMQAARALLAAGFTNVLEQRAGWEASYGTFGEIKEPGWSRAGLPTEKG